MRTTFAFLCAVAGCIAAPVNEKRAAPSVTVRNGTIVGSTALGIDTFNGM